jgi:hypothetical protein
MVSKCANPDCTKELHYLREGKVYLFEVPNGRRDENGRAEHHPEHFWLCGECARVMSLVHTGDNGVQAVKRPVQSRGAVMHPQIHAQKHGLGRGTPELSLR